MPNTEFEKFVLDGAVEAPTYPTAYYDADHDSYEFFLEQANFYARRVDPSLAVYISRESGEVIGGRVSGLSKLLGRMLRDAN